MVYASSYKRLKLDTCNWTPMWSRTDYARKTPTYPIEQNRTKNQSNLIELQSFNWVRQSHKIEHLFCCEFDYRTNRTNIIEQNRINPMQLSLDASNWVKHVEYNHCQLLLNNQELNIIRSVIERSIVFDWQNFIVSSIMFDWVWQSNDWCSIAELFDWISRGKTNWSRSKIILKIRFKI